MERRVRGSLIRTGAAVFAAFVFMVCSNPIDIVGNVTTEVKTANNKFLLIKGVGPSTNTTNVNPGLPLTITFDRDVELTDIDKKVAITPSSAFRPPSYNSATKTLTLEPDPFLNDNTSYTVTITTGVRGSDGSDLQNEYSWSFKTGIYPTGSVLVTNGLKEELGLTNNDLHPTLRIQSNAAANRFRLGRSESECLAAGWQTLASTDWLISDASLAPPNGASFTLGSVDGQQAVYVQFLRDSDLAMSLTKFDTVTMDKTAPSVDAGQQRWVNNVTTTTPYLAAASDLNGIKSYGWSAPAPVVVSPANVFSPTLSAPGGSDGNYTVTLTVVDNAGNSASDTMTLTRDTVVPNGAPAITAPDSPTASAFPYWSWTKTSTSGGESTPIYRLLMDGVQVKDKSVTANYTPQLKPPKAIGLADGSHTLTVYETDNAGNLSVPSTSTVTVSGLPHRTTLATYTPTFYWHTLWDERGYAAEAYYLHIGLEFNKGEMKEIVRPFLVNPVESKDWVQSFTLPSGILNKFNGQTVYWYVEWARQGVRCPADPYQAWYFLDPNL